MSDIFSILQSSYSSNASSAQSLIPPGAKFANVDPTQWQGTWTGKDQNRQPYTIKINQVSGYRANVSFQSASGLQSARVFITTKNTFRIGDSSFALTGKGTATVSTVITNALTGGESVVQSQATLQS